MNGLLEKIVRRRRATTTQRLGPQAQDGTGAGGYNGIAGSVSPDEPRLEPLPARRGGPAGGRARPPAKPRARPPAEPRIRPPAEPRARPPAEPQARSQPSGRERSRMRRRASYLRALRELQLRDLGGFLVELQRFGKRRPDLVEAKVEEAARTDAELRELDTALNEPGRPAEVRQPGIGGACGACGTVHGSTDRYCSWCGHQL